MQFLRMWKFLVVVLVSVFGYGIFMTAMLFPEAKFNGEVLFHIFFRPYLILFGEPGIESFEREIMLVFSYGFLAFAAFFVCGKTNVYSN